MYYNSRFLPLMMAWTTELPEEITHIFVDHIVDIKGYEVPRYQLIGPTRWAMAKNIFDVWQVVAHICRFTKH